MTKYFLLITIVCGLLFGLIDNSNAQGAKIPDTIYVVDMQKVLSDCVAGKAAKNNMEEEMKKKRLVLDKMKLELDQLKQEVDKQSTLLSKEAMEAKQEQIFKKQRDLERVYQDQREELAQKNQDAVGKIVKEIDEAIKKLAAQNKYKYVFEKDARTVVYVNDKFDISDEVIKLLDSEKLAL